MYYIEKQFDAAVAHRVHNQQLCGILRDNVNRAAPCKSIHGHSATFIVGLTSTELVNDMVIDFNMIGFVKKALDQHYDHRFTICKNDPLFEFLVVEAYNRLIDHGINAGVISEHIPVEFHVIDELDGGIGYRTWTVVIPDQIRQIDDPLIELLDSFTITEFTTTSENLAHWMFNVVKNRLYHVYETTNDQFLRTLLKGVKVTRVSYKESAKSIAVYQE